MYKVLTAILLICSLWGCKDTAEETRQFSAYFDVDSMINAQLVLMSDMRIKVNKAAELNSATDSISYVADSLRLAQELNVFRKANINKPAYDGAYSAHENNLGSGKEVIYTPVDEDNNLEVKLLTLTYQDGDLIKMVANIEEDHWLYNSRRMLRLEFYKEDEINLIKSYFIDGTQKMVLRDRASFVVAADLLQEDSTY